MQMGDQVDAIVLNELRTKSLGVEQIELLLRLIEIEPARRLAKECFWRLVELGKVRINDDWELEIV